MDYTLGVVYENGEARAINCSTLTDVSNNMHSIMRSQCQPDIDAKSVTFTVAFNFSGKD